MQFLRKLLFPFSLVYDVVTSLRNLFFEIGFFKSKTYAIPLIAVGNLNVGGTGKTPMIEYLIRLLQNDNKIATLSRGYGRKSKGYVLGNSNATAEDLGDEPLQFYSKFPKINVAVDGNRQEGIARLQLEVQPDIILLDDAFQHRKVTADFYILLTKFNDLYSDDLLLPAGNLRESKRGAARARIIIVTKCPNDLSITEQQLIKQKLKASQNQQIYFSTISYSDTIYSQTTEVNLTDLIDKNITLVTGIANPAELILHLKENKIQFTHLNFKDHHIFTESELNELRKKELILTTEKDFMRLKDKLSNLFCLPIHTQFLNSAIDFDNQVNELLKVVKTTKRSIKTALKN